MIDPVKKNKAKRLRRAGYSYSYIFERTAIPKGTLSYLLNGVVYRPNRFSLAKISNARMKIAKKQSAQKAASMLQADSMASEEIGHLSARDLMMLGLGLYIGEGTKTANVLRIVNSNPAIINIAIKWLVQSIGIKRENIRIRLHLYPDINEKEAIAFWSKTTGLKHQQFQKPYIDRRIKKKKKRLANGTCHLNVKSVGVLVVRKIYAMIDRVLNYERD